MGGQRGVAVLGATGSIGVSTLDVVNRYPERFRVVALSAHTRWRALLKQCLIYRPRYAVFPGPEAGELQRLLRAANCSTEVLGEPQGLEAVARDAEVDVVVAAIVGAAGLPPAMAAARAGKTILLANKEALVMAGPVFMEAVARHGATLLPVDSEHSAVFQVLPPGFSGNLQAAGIRRILLTASGGPFRTLSATELSQATPRQACAHPTWNMGPKISVDSATLMNKGLEVIEARWLFNAHAEQIQVVVHPQSVVHSLVEYADGSVLAQLGHPDMRTPIAYALGYPERIEAGVPMLDLFRVGPLQFEPPDMARFPCLGLAYQALEREGSAPAALNAANEVAVAAFLEERISFPAIPAVIRHALDSQPWRSLSSLDDVLEADRDARETAKAWIRGRYR